MRRHVPSAPLSLRLSQAQHVALFVVGLGLWASGVLWLLFHYLLHSTAEFGVGSHPLEPWWLKLHGAFAFAAIWLFGLLWAQHVVPGWSGGRLRKSGAWLVGSFVWLIASGYLLYYLGNEQARAVTSVLHWSIGLVFPALFATHRLIPHRSRRSVSDISKRGRTQRAP